MWWLILIVPILLMMWLGWLVYNAPHGYQDDTGFHYGDEYDWF